LYREHRPQEGLCPEQRSQEGLYPEERSQEGLYLEHRSQEGLYREHRSKEGQCRQMIEEEVVADGDWMPRFVGQSGRCHAHAAVDIQS
jgi:hypothetical protein